MPIEPGSSLLHYRITEKLGEGGMGVVWKAVDTSLDREVAIKVLLPQVASQPEHLARFDREAKLLASINHPNIAAVYGFHEHDATRFVVMEMVEGGDLSQRIQRGPMPVDEALETAARIAEALAAAHERGVIHRDLKPANVRVTPDGTIKVLDFGLAKSFDPAGASGDDPTASPTVTSGGTAFGMILGTAAYMSPTTRCTSAKTRGSWKSRARSSMATARPDLRQRYGFRFDVTGDPMHILTAVELLPEG